MARRWIAIATIALLATRATAAEPPREYRPAGLTKRVNSHGRSVRVMRGEPQMLPEEITAEEMLPADLSEDETLGPELVQHMHPVPAPQMAPAPDDFDDSQWTEEWQTTGPCESGECELDCEECPEPCVECGMLVCACTPYWAHRTFVFGEYLYLLPTDVDMAHAFQQNGVGGLGTVPLGQTGVVQPDFSSAYRVGFGVAVGCYATIGASYSNFHSHATDQLAALPNLGDTVASLVLHPNSINAGSTSSLVNAALDIDYQLADIDYRRLLSGNERHFLNYGVGVRYGKLDQEFLQIGEFSPPTGTLQTTSNITFEGVGLRAGFDGEHRLGCSRFAGYGKLFANVLFGEFQSAYTQLDTTTTDRQAQAFWDDRRVVPILEYEVGLSWTSRKGHWRLATGYYTAFWFNSVTTGEFVQAVQTANFVDVGETISFTGLVSRLEFRF